MAAIIETLMDRYVLTGILAIISVTATFITIFGPALQPDPMKVRVRNVVEHRDKLRNERKLALSGRNQQKSLRNESAQGVVRQVVQQFKLFEMFDAEAAATKLAMAGKRGERPVTIFMFSRLVAPLVVSFIAALYLYVFEAVDVSSSSKVFILVAAFCLGFYAPSIYISNAISKRRQLITLALSDALDLLIICVESGMSIEAGFQKVADEFAFSCPPLSEEFALTTAELSYLPERKMAYENLSDRTGIDVLKALVTALVQAEIYGTPIGSALRVMAAENRENRMLAAEKKAAALPPKLTVPMILFFLPVLFVVILGPVVIIVTGNAETKQEEAAVLNDSASR